MTPKLQASQAKVTLPDLFAGMNKTEKAMAIQLEAQKRAGLIHAWYYEKVTLKIGHDCRYTPDFMVIGTDGSVRFIETKGFWRDDAKVKARVMREQFPFFPLETAVLKKGVWTNEQF